MFICFWRLIQRANKSNPEIKRNGEAFVRSIGGYDITEDRLEEMR
jgi:hypothetical protein